MSQTLLAYQRLKSLPQIQDKIGCSLATVEGANLMINSKLCDLSELKNILSDWLSAKGWYQTSGATGFGIPEQIANLLEGEWHNGQATLSLRLVAPKQYRVTEIQSEAVSTDSDYCYQDQEIYLRGDLYKKSNNTVNAVIYRQWFQCKDYAWKPVASQFLGFSYIEEQK